MPTQSERPDTRDTTKRHSDVTLPTDGVGSWLVAARWWEPQRVLYNAVLVAVFVALLMRTWDRIAPELTPPNILRLGVLALIMNLCYSAAYAADFALQSARSPHARAGWRWALWVGGTGFAVLLETYWYLDEILPPLG
jgi:hypothetical protein